MTFRQFIGVALGLCTVLAAHAQSLTRTAAAQRQSDAPALFNWNYSAIYGTGFYNIGEETVAVLRIPFSHWLREPVEDRWGLKLTAPVSTALAQFDLHGLQLGHVNTLGLSVLPGLQWERRLKSGWDVKPFINAGKGWEFNSHTNATIWSTGVSTRYQTSLAPRWLGGTGVKITYAGFQAREQSNVLGALAVGGDLGYITGHEIRGRRAIVGAQVTLTRYFNRLEFLLPGSETQSVSNERSIAFTLGAAKPFEIYGASVDRFGIGYREGSNGLKGVELVASFPF